MPLTPLQIKFRLLEKAGSLINAAKQMSDADYSFSADQLSKVIRGTRCSGHATKIIQVRVARFLGEQEQKIWGTARKLAQAARVAKN